MGKRKGRKENQQPIHSERDEDGGGGDEKGAGFFSCYLLTSICPRFKGHTYIGFTVNPRRRIRQHNGEIGSGAWRTKRKRPWEMVLCIYGFPTNVAALQFEWAWQHPVESLAVRSAAASFKSLSGLANKIKLAYTMLTLPAWQSLNLTVNLFSTKYQKHTSGCPTLPEQMRTKICSMDDLPCYNASDCPIDNDDDDDECEGLFQESTEPESSARISEDYPNYKSSPEEYIHQEIELSGCYSRTWAEWPKKNSPPIREEEEEDHGQFFIVNDSPERTSFSDIAEKAQNPRLNELNTEFDEPLEKQSATPLVAAEKDEVLIMSPNIMSHGVEIIDIFTPSPCYRVNSGRKKRKPNLFPEVIDLTNSPMYV